MPINRKDCIIETMRGTGPGGQHKNKKDTAVRLTHKKTGVTSYADERSQKHSLKTALKELNNKINNIKQQRLAEQKKARRDHIIHNTPIIRTYDYSRGIVKDHRTKKTASLKDVIKKGKFDLLNP